MPKIAIIGAGSIVFCKTLILDVLASGLEDVEFCLMAPSERKTGYVKRFADRVIQANGLSARVSVTTDRRESVRDADYVISTFQIGGLRATELDYEIPIKYGVDQCIGDTLGPGGIFRALRSIPVTVELARDVEVLSPNAFVLNYVNPMSMVCWALGTTGVRFVGLCHGVQVSLDLVSGYCQVPKPEITYLSAGINHMAWFLKLEHKGVNLYPLLREKFEQPEYYVNEKVRGEVFRHFGYFMTESTGHLSEYLPYFRKNQKALELYCDEPAFGGESGAHVRWSRVVAAKYAEGDILKDEPSTLPPRSIEYGSYIIEAIETGVPFHFQGNVINSGMISNLPADCCVEGPMVADASGLHKVIVGDLPSPCAALNLTNVNVHRLTVEAALSGDPELIVHACALDPLSSAVLTLKEIRDMASEMLETQRDWLPQFEGRRIRPAPTISIPRDVKRAKVPIDPALAIAQRFGELTG
jgi:alpha-galactosidase